MNPATLKFTGLIDFGDAYIGPPAFDWRWPLPEHRIEILNGYKAEGRLVGQFLSAWRPTMMLMEMTAFANRPERRIAALGTLAWLSRELGLGR